MVREPSSLLLLIDGYNVIPPIAAPGRRPSSDWLHRERVQFIQRLTTHLNDRVLSRTCVVFDATDPPRDRPHRFEVKGLRVWYSVGYREADDLLEELILQHSAPKQLAVVSSDRRVQVAAARRGATAFESQEWLDRLLEGICGLAPSQQAKLDREGQGSDDDQKPLPNHDETDDWMKEFGF